MTKNSNKSEKWTFARGNTVDSHEASSLGRTWSTWNTMLFVVKETVGDSFCIYSSFHNEVTATHVGYSTILKGGIDGFEGSR